MTAAGYRPGRVLRGGREGVVAEPVLEDEPMFDGAGEFGGELADRVAILDFGFLSTLGDSRFDAATAIGPETTKRSSTRLWSLNSVTTFRSCRSTVPRTR